MIKFKIFLSFFLWSVLVPVAYAQSHSDFLEKMPHEHYNHLTLCGDVFSLAMPTAAVLSAYAQDYRPIFSAQQKGHKALLKVGLSSFLSDKLKRTFKYSSWGKRPNGYHSSFPSSHTSFAFTGAYMIAQEHSLPYGALAYTAAALTAYSRIEGRYHRLRDIAGGIAVSAFSCLVVDQLSALWEQQGLPSFDFLENIHLSPRKFKIQICF